MDAAAPSASEPTDRLGEQRSEHLEAVRRYVRGPLARRLGVEGRPARVEPAVHGKRSLVYFVDIEGTAPTVVRAVPRFADAWKLAHNLRAFQTKKLRVPTLVAADLSPLTRLRWGFWPLVEERIEGGHLDELGRPEAAVRAVASTLAQFHNVTRRRWGWPALPRWGSYGRHLLARMEKRARNFDAVLDTPRAAMLMQWCRERAAQAPLAPPFSLTHSRIYCPNFIVTPANDAYAIDLLECRFGTFGIDLTWALERLCAGEPQPCAWFLDAYFAERPAGRRGAYERSLPFFQVDYHLARASLYARRLPRRMHVPQARQQKLDALDRHAARLSHLTGIQLTIKAPG